MPVPGVAVGSLPGGGERGVGASIRHISGTSTEKLLEVGASSVIFDHATCKIACMAEVTRRRVGRPRNLGYTPVQLKVNVHPNVRNTVNAAAGAKGLNPNAYLTELIARDMGCTVQELIEQGVLPVSA